MLFKNWKQEILSIPNLLSIFRLIMIPIYLTIFFHATKPIHYLAAGMILALSCLTDMMDGKIARQYHMVTTTGKILDPLADKATQFSLMLCLSVKHPALIPVLLLFIVKECFQITAGIIAYTRGRMLPGALMAGKVCTSVLFVSLILLVLFPVLPSPMVRIIALSDFACLLLSFVSYVLAYYGKNKKTENFRAI